ncbi:aminoacylase-1 [Quillaja saponaria]|uniref:Aminoacylase-1 n=1 Tax=Quillaja saponaria TaxID=32244 RepID=A0AAD7KNA9_QUISA|nr:aminoacylase-1 [Quillaja saponaria]
MLSLLAVRKLSVWFPRIPICRNKSYHSGIRAIRSMVSQMQAEIQRLEMRIKGIQEALNTTVEELNQKNEERVSHMMEEFKKMLEAQTRSIQNPPRIMVGNGNPGTYTNPGNAEFGSLKQKVSLHDKFGKPILATTDTSSVWWTLLEAAVRKAGRELGKAEIFPASTDTPYFRKRRLPAIGFSPMSNTPILLHDHNKVITN